MKQTLNRGSFLYNKKVEYQKRIDDFPTQVKVVFGASILAALLIVIAVFIASIRSAEKAVQLFNP